MNFKKYIKAFVISNLAMLVSVTAAFSQNYYGLNTSQVEQLKLLSVPIFAPKYIPKGFKIKTVNITNAGTSIGNNYKITYENILGDAKSSQFYIETNNEGIGEIFLSNPLKLKTKLGNTNIYVDSRFDNDSNIKMTNCVVMDWICYEGNCYRLVSGGDCFGDKNDEFIKRISKDEAVKIISSIEKIK